MILVSGPTGSGKSSTLAALIQEINLTETRHIITIESPIEYTFRPRRSYIRQREVGRDTPSFEQALLDSLREDPDVLMVGEMREPETMRLTLSASETGHLVLATLHSSTCAEALQRIVSAFPAEIQSSVAAQLADCLIGVISQRLRFRPELNIRVPGVRDTHGHACGEKLHSQPGLFQNLIGPGNRGRPRHVEPINRYRHWLDSRTNWYLPGQNPEPAENEMPDADTPAPLATPSSPQISSAPKPATTLAPALTPKKAGERIEIEPVEGDFGKILKRPGE